MRAMFPIVFFWALIRRRFRRYMLYNPGAILFFRLAYGSMGLEFWNGLSHAAWGVIFLFIPPQNPSSSIGRLISSTWPYGPLYLLAFGMTHLFLLSLPANFRTVAVRKAICIIAVMFWLEVARGLFGMHFYGLSGSVIFVAAMLTLAISRSDY